MPVPCIAVEILTMVIRDGPNSRVTNVTSGRWQWPGPPKRALSVAHRVRAFLAVEQRRLDTAGRCGNQGSCRGAANGMSEDDRAFARAAGQARGRPVSPAIGPLSRAAAHHRSDVGGSTRANTRIGNQRAKL